MFRCPLVAGPLSFTQFLREMTSIYMTSINEKLVRHAVSRIRDAEVYSEPFPHLFFGNFFPADIYAEILSSIPDDSVFRPLNGENTRLSFALHNSSSKLDPKIRDLWQSVSAMLMSTELEQAIRTCLFEGLEIRRRAENLSSVDELPMYARPVIYKDLEGYRIVPHPDTRKKIVTMQIYCPPDESLCDLGTTFYKLSLKGLLKPSSRFLEPALAKLSAGHRDLPVSAQCRLRICRAQAVSYAAENELARTSAHHHGCFKASAVDFEYFL